MQHVEGTFKGFEGLDLYYQSWHPRGTIQGTVALVHGLGGYSGLFNPAVETLTSQNFEVYAFDLRGHGRSPGQRGYINSWSEFREDLRLFLQQIHEKRLGGPYFLWGHSLGGTIVLDYVLRSPERLQGLIVTAPALGRVGISPVKLGLGLLLSGVWPRFSLKLGIPNDFCERDPELCAVYLQDTLRHEYGSARLATEFFATVDWIYKHTSNLQIPLLLLHCSTDAVTLPEASRDFFRRVMFSDKEYHEYAGCCHDLYSDVDYQVLTDLEHWLGKHLDPTVAYGSSELYAS
ncbi:lysophospholipase [Cyanobacteria bacterium FACHB-471]|nr:lysophospholipase [Cyanobacteria bacterium FACHB-471]